MSAEIERLNYEIHKLKETVCWLNGLLKKRNEERNYLEQEIEYRDILLQDLKSIINLS